MLHHFVVLAAGVPNITPNYNSPLSPLINKLLALILGLLALGSIVFFFSGGFQIVTSIGSHHEGGARAGAMKMVASAIFLAFLFIGTPLVNTWANFFSS